MTRPTGIVLCHQPTATHLPFAICHLPCAIQSGTSLFQHANIFPLVAPQSQLSCSLPLSRTLAMPFDFGASSRVQAFAHTDGNMSPMLASGATPTATASATTAPLNVIDWPSSWRCLSSRSGRLIRCLFYPYTGYLNLQTAKLCRERHMYICRPLFHVEGTSSNE